MQQGGVSPGTLKSVSTIVEVQINPDNKFSKSLDYIPYTQEYTQNF